MKESAGGAAVGGRGQARVERRVEERVVGKSLGNHHDNQCLTAPAAAACNGSPEGKGVAATEFGSSQEEVKKKRWGETW